MWLADTSHRVSRVATGSVNALGGSGVFHHRPIPPQFLCVDLHSVAVNAPLMVPVEEADEENLNDALGSSILWAKALTFLQD